MAVRTTRRLPGFRFEYQPPPPTDVLPRMDVAVFVGFAASGPLHVPVAVEEVAQFTTLFGDDVPLAWDTKRSTQVYAYLAPAVRSFFGNGGRRCWIIRVAGNEAQYNYFPVPGLALLDADGSLTPAFARARSQGSWSDDLRVGASLSSSPVIATNFLFSTEKKFVSVNLALKSPGDISTGDLVRLTFSEGDYVLLLLVDSVLPLNGTSTNSTADSSGNRSIVQVTARVFHWFKAAPPRSPLPSPTQAIIFTHDTPLPPKTVSNYTEMAQAIGLDLGVSFADAPEPGTLIRVDFDTDQLWLTVQTVHVKPDTDTIVSVTGQGLWSLPQPPDPLPTTLARAEILSFTLQVQQGNGYPLTLSNLTFGIDHPHFWNALPTDEQLYRNTEVTSDPSHSILSRTVANTPYADLWQSALNPRLPLAGSDAPAEHYFPIAMPVSADYFLGKDKGSTNPPVDARTRDGLQEFSINYFLDVDMIEALTPDLLLQADYLRYSSLQTRPLTGIYAALSIEEASLIAIPDAYQRGWEPTHIGDPPPPQASKPLPHPERWHCQADMTTDEGQNSQPPQGTFHSCDIQIIAPPSLEVLAAPDTFGTFKLGWEAEVTGNAIYVLEEALRPDWVDVVTIYRGANQSLRLYGRGQGDYYYRVRVEVVLNTANATTISSDWSKGLSVRVTTTGLWQLKGEEQYDTHDLIALQRLLVRMCAARGDLFAVLALPEHYHGDDAIAHLARLKSLLLPIQVDISSDQDPKNVRLVLPLNYGERSAFSYGSLYHPWVVMSEGLNQLNNIPPDGTACGSMASLALTRGAWIAPANEPLSGVVDLTPTISRVNWQDLQDAQLNLIRQEPRGFLSLNSDTLSDEEDSDLRPINVRRLLILLRRLALLLGATYVFEPNSDAFRRLVQREFESLLGQMFAQGAFAGNTPDTSFQVVTDTSINTSQSVDQGRFIVELRVAPSLPMTFLTIRLVQSATDGSITEVR